MTTATTARRARTSREAPAHTCVDCLKRPPLPDKPADVDPKVEYRPKVPRPAKYGGPRTPRCYSHQQAEDRRKRQLARHTRVTRVFGLPADEQTALLEFQHGRCACGRRPGLAGVHTDHCHECCPGDTSCGKCVRGFLDSQCNREILGRLEHVFRDEPSPALAAAEALVRLASHLVDPPLARLRRGAETPYADAYELSGLLTRAHARASREDVPA